MLRSKGYFWISCEPDTRFDMNIVGPMCELIVNTVWLDSGLKWLMDPRIKMQMLRQHDPNDENDKQIIQEKLEHRNKSINDMMKRLELLRNKGKLHSKFVDRRIELVFIGDETMKKDEIIDVLNQSLMKSDELEMGPNNWIKQNNPFSNVPRCVVI